MKHILIICMVAAFTLLWGCRAHYPVAQSTGNEDIAYLLFVSRSNAKPQIVDVTLNGKRTFRAVTVKARKANRRGTQYTVQPGTVNIRVASNGSVLYEKKLFLSTGETKQIMLP